jgi:hypothetical protein
MSLAIGIIESAAEKNISGADVSACSSAIEIGINIRSQLALGLRNFFILMTPTINDKDKTIYCE